MNQILGTQDYPRHSPSRMGVMAEVMRLKPVTGCGETVGRPAEVVQPLHEAESVSLRASQKP